MEKIPAAQNSGQLNYVHICLHVYRLVIARDTLLTDMYILDNYIHP